MKIRFWGTRGSYPVSFSARMNRERLLLAIEQANQSLEKKAPKGELEAFITKSLPFHLHSTYGTNTLCVEIENEESEYILCDCGTGIIDFAKHIKYNLKKPTGNTFHIFLSHLHWDHIQGFPFFALAFGRGNRIIIHGYHDKTADVFESMMSAPVFPVALSQLSSQIVFDIQKPEVPFYVCDFLVSSMIQNHPGVSYCYKFEKQGKKIIYSTDCEHTKGQRNQNHPFVKFCQGGDILMFDAMSSLSELEQVGWGHSTYKVGVEIATWSQIKQLLFIHHDPELSDEELDTFIPLSLEYQKSYTQSQSISGNSMNISMAYDSLELDI